MKTSLKPMVASFVAASCLWSLVPASLTSAQEIVLKSIARPLKGATVATYGLTRDDCERIKATVPSIQQLVPVRRVQQRASVGDAVVDTEVVGTVAQFAKLGQFEVQQGRFLTDADSGTRNNVAVINTRVAQQLFAGRNVLGENVAVGGDYYLVVGRVTLAGSDNAVEKAKPCIFIPITTMLSRMGDLTVDRSSGTIRASQYELSEIRIVMQSFPAVERAAETIRTLLQKTHEQQDYSIHVNERPRTGK